MHNKKMCNITLIYGRIVEILASHNKSELRNAMVTSDFRPDWTDWQNSRILQETGSRMSIGTSDFRTDVEIWLYCTCTIKICTITTIYGRITKNSCVLQEIEVKEVDAMLDFRLDIKNGLSEQMQYNPYLRLNSPSEFPCIIRNLGWKHNVNVKLFLTETALWKCAVKNFSWMTER